MSEHIRTFSGIRFYPLDPRIEDIHILDIAHSQATSTRYNGHLPVPYFLAQHSVIVSRHCYPENALWGLLHDAFEAYLPDMPSPIKHDPRFLFYRRAEAKGMLLICEKFDLPPRMPEDVHEADKRCYLTELRDLRGRAVDKDGYIINQEDNSFKKRGWKPFDEIIKPWDWLKAERKFLQRFNELVGHSES